MYPESCLLLKFHLLPHPSLWGSPTATFQLLEVARFLPALGIILVLPEGSFTVVSLAASSESHSQSYFLSGFLGHGDWSHPLLPTACPHMQLTSSPSLTTCYLSPLMLGNLSCVSLVLVCLPYWTQSSMRRVKTVPMLFTTATPGPSQHLALRGAHCVFVVEWLEYSEVVTFPEAISYILYLVLLLW